MPATSPTPSRPQPRPEIAALPAYSRAFAADEPPRYRSSSNESPWGPPDSVVAAASAAAATANRYPRLHADDLIAAIASYHGLPPAQVAVGDGSLSLMTYALLAYTARADEVVHSWRSYEAYPIAITAAGGVPVPVDNAHDGRHDLPAMAAAVTARTAAVIVCSPNNPTGSAVTHDELSAFLRAVPSRVLVILDEAYGDFAADGTDAPRSIDLLERHENLVVLRTFSKSYALAGLRVGWLIGHPDVVKPITAIQPPFPVSAPAIAAAIAALSDQASRRRTIDAARGQRTELTSVLRRAGLPVTDSSANFVWLPLAEGAESFARACSNARIAVRCFPGEGVRISLGEPGLVDAVREALRAMAALSDRVA